MLSLPAPCPLARHCPEEKARGPGLDHGEVWLPPRLQPHLSLCPPALGFTRDQDARLQGPTSLHGYPTPAPPRSVLLLTQFQGRSYIKLI